MVQVSGEHLMVTQIVLDMLNLPLEKARERTRLQGVTVKRQRAYYLIRELTNGKMSYPAIGLVFERDHSSVIYGYDVIAKMAESSPVFKSGLRRELELARMKIEEILLRAKTRVSYEDYVASAAMDMVAV